MFSTSGSILKHSDGFLRARQFLLASERILNHSDGFLRARQF
jgi:hypothetical protein